MLLHIMLHTMVRAGDIEFPDPSQGLYFRGEETVSQILQIAFFVEDSFIRGRQVDGSSGCLEGDDRICFLTLKFIRGKPVITFQNISSLATDQCFDLLLFTLVFCRNIL